MDKRGTQYAINPLAPFPKRWRDHLGPIRVMHEPVEGYVMVRRPRAYPFVLRVSDLLNATEMPPHGPFTVEPRPRRALDEGGER